MIYLDHNIKLLNQSSDEDIHEVFRKLWVSSFAWAAAAAQLRMAVLPSLDFVGIILPPLSDTPQKKNQKTHSGDPQIQSQHA